MGVVRDLTAFIARLGVAAVLLVNGLEKFLLFGIGRTSGMFAAMGVPLPPVSAWVAALVETIGAAALILGLLLPLFGVLIALEMAGALLFVDVPRTGLVSVATFEALLVGVAALALGFNGGRWTIDHALFGRDRGRHLRAAAPQT